MLLENVKDVDGSLGVNARDRRGLLKSYTTKILAKLPHKHTGYNRNFCDS